VSRSTIPRPLMIVIDLAIVVVFVAIGRSSHHHGLKPNGMISTLWPFVLGLAVGWIFNIRRRRSGATLRSGVEIGLITVVIGMLARVVSGQGTAFTFIVVATVFLVGLMVVWRYLSKKIR
jgi:uncharacterized membrane protein (UPF0136 family)